MLRSELCHSIISAFHPTIHLTSQPCHLQPPFRYDCIHLVPKVLQEEVMEFVNSIAKIVHTSVASHGGAANKNIGDAFLLVSVDSFCDDISHVCVISCRLLKRLKGMEISRWLWNE